MTLKTIITEKMVFGGDCIGKIDGKTIFIPFSLPGETLEIEITTSRRDYDTARITSIKEPSPHRVSPVCPLYGVCGGCNMLHADADYQRELRATILKDSFVRAGLQVPDSGVLFGKDTGYRCRFQFHDGSLTARGTNDIVPLSRCPVASDEINGWLAAVPQDRRPRGRVHVFGGNCVVPDPKREFPQIILAQEQEKNSQESKQGKYTIKGRHKQRFTGTVLNPANIATVNIAGKKIQFDVQGFFQSNSVVLEKAVDKLCSGLSGRNVLDMYCGAGTFSVFLADRFENVTLVEHNRDALVFAEMNMAGTLHTSYGISGKKWVQENANGILERDGAFDAVVIDPPRSGMEPEVCDWLCKTHPHQIRSVSCDPATHARDAARLVRAGYRIQELYLLDFYPGTSHIESLAFFEYNG